MTEGPTAAGVGRTAPLVNERLVLWYFVAALTYFALSLLAGLLMATQLVNYNPLKGLELFSPGRWRMVHTNAIAYGFLANAFLGSLHWAVPRLTLRLVADDGDAAGGPLQLVARGVLVMPVALRATGCRGQVKLVVKAGQRVVRRGTARLKLEGGVCRYTVTLTFGQRARRAASVVNVVASFVGNEEARPASSPTRTAPLA